MFVDTDLLLHPSTIDRMLSADAPIVFGVFWTKWPGQNYALPQVWDRFPYGYWETTLEDNSKINPTIELLKLRQDIEVNGGGACTLIRKEAFNTKYSPPLQGMPWLGEDRDFCARAQSLDHKMMAVGSVDIIHLYDESSRDEISVNDGLSQLGFDYSQIQCL